MSSKHYLGIDLGTSAVKVLLLNDTHTIIAQTQRALSVQHTQPLFSEQDPHQWWQALDEAMLELASIAGDALLHVAAIGLAGQMHGVVLLSASEQVLRPAILWNDGRSSEQCTLLETRLPQLRELTGNIAMPGFSAPKLLWVAQHEPELFKKIWKVLLPKDFLRFKMSGQCVSDMSDAAGTLWLDTAQRKWSPKALAACGLKPSQMPDLCEGNQISAVLHSALVLRWGLNQARPILIAGGGGDNAASAIGLGLIHPGQGFVSLGTSGVVFATQATYNSEKLPGNSTVHTFCHALPNNWHCMSVMLSCAASIDWATQVLGFASAQNMLEGAQKTSLQTATLAAAPLFLPYLTGERSPHNNAYASGVWYGLKAQHTANDLAYAASEGVCFGLLDGYLSLPDAHRPEQLYTVGGLSQNAFFLQLLADTLGVPVSQVEDGWAGAALGAARLAWLCDGAAPGLVCLTPALRQIFQPAANSATMHSARYTQFKRLYHCLSSEFSPKH